MLPRGDYENNAVVRRDLILQPPRAETRKLDDTQCGLRRGEMGSSSPARGEAGRGSGYLEGWPSVWALSQSDAPQD